MNNYKVLLCFLGCMLGPALGGFFLGKSIERFKLNDRIVVVKGLSEREVKSDLAVWNLSYKNSGNDLVQIDQKMASDRAEIEKFLTNAGFNRSEISIDNIEVSDRDAREYGSMGDQKKPRYVLTGKIIVRTNKVDLVASAQGKIGGLIKDGIVISGTPNYYFTKLVDIRPQMIAEATKNARVSAQQFADDSGCKVGAIRSANQGVFSIAAKDSLSQDSQYSDSYNIDKKVRVVSTITFNLVS